MEALWALIIVFGSTAIWLLILQLIGLLPLPDA